MITGEIKNKIDQIWDTFFVAGITNPITVLEQMTYIFFMKMLDDKQLQEEENARDWDCEVENPTFLNGQLWVNPEAVSDEERAGVPYENLRCTYSRTSVPTICSRWFVRACSSLSSTSALARSLPIAAT